MDIFILLTMLALGAFVLKSREQSRCIALLGRYLSQHKIEKLMESLTDGYLRALGESDPARQAQIWNLLSHSEAELSAQFARFAAEFAKVDVAQARVSTFALAIPYANQLFPTATFDLRKALKIHAQGIANAVQHNSQQSPRDKAFTLSAELFLMQHTCHWFCRSKTMASARLQARHKTMYSQVLAAVAPDTRRAYCALTGADVAP
jgi:hypothetical protein